MCSPTILPAVRALAWVVVFGALGGGCYVGGDPYFYDDEYPADTAPADQVDIDTFEVRLAPFGVWITTPEHGRVWRPRDVPPDWRPYTHGHWVDTEYGWTWISDFAWGWAPFHYGRWWRHPHHSWVWIPGTVWGPAWVAWRTGDAWIGWAPLPPQVPWRPGVGLVFTDGQLDLWIDLSWWCFVEPRDFLTRPLHRHVVGRSQHRGIWRHTRHDTRYGVRRGRVWNGGVPVRRISTVTGRKVPRHRIRYVAKPPRPRKARKPTVVTPRRRTTPATSRRREIHVYRPRRTSPVEVRRPARRSARRQPAKAPSRRVSKAGGNG